ncbi:ATPase [Desulfonema ishimotonii]|uniref:ATPase n=1 Tax=Desulfonema ishimotonii TaxID=45657 RepID=A0A401G4A8_9BACT|nr:ATPase [Desulfonema ishimotonii]GBC64077.1 ATPase [Desulfonema ishimotonii]
MIKIDSSVFIQVANFLVLIWAMNAILYRPIRNILNKRKDTVSGLEGDISSCSQGVREKDAAYADGVKTARVKGLEAKKSLIEVAEKEERAIVSKINEKAQADLVAVRGKIAKDAERVKQSLLQEVDKFANEIGEKILGRAI